MISDWNFSSRIKTMSILNWFPKKQKTNNEKSKLSIPGDLWVKCFKCGDIIYLKDLESNQKVCVKCNYHFRLTPEERISHILDKNTFNELETEISPIDTLGFSDSKPYKTRIQEAQKKTGRKDAMVIGIGKINKTPINIGFMDFAFLGGSMGAVVGEKTTRLIELAIKNKNPLVIFTASGGARMQEGILSLMQMAKTSAALKALDKQKVPFISVLCDPTTGGTTASFAMLGDILISEPDALITFAGPRVIEQTIRQKLPEGFQRAEFLLEHGIIDMVVERKDLKETIANLVMVLNPNNMRAKE
jgi:acetyl-CoA carboxylase carboxyl transferase subunit beta